MTESPPAPNSPATLAASAEVREWQCSHNTAFRTAWLNTALGWCTGLILMMPPLAFKYEHADHHTYTQDAERDPQMIFGNAWRGYPPTLWKQWREVWNSI